jgi:DNA-binding MarR family transcriptional regulator
VQSERERQLLESLDAQRPVTQRGLASELGIALGLTNLLIRGLIRKGWVRIRRVSSRRVRYLITPAGAAARARLAREYFLETLAVYRESRERMRERLAEVSAAIGMESGGAHGQHPVVFYGGGPVAEVAYVCLQETDLQLVALISAVPSRPFFQVIAYPPSELTGAVVAGQPFTRIIVMPLQDETEVRAQLAARGVPEGVVFWV